MSRKTPNLTITEGKRVTSRDIICQHAANYGWLRERSAYELVNVDMFTRGDGYALVVYYSRDDRTVTNAEWRDERMYRTRRDDILDVLEGRRD